MTLSYRARHIGAGAITFTAATAISTAAVMAACGGAPTLVALGGLVGPPSITATEASTDQALELIRKRREEAGGACPTGFTRSGGNCVPTGSAQVASAAQASAAPAPAPQPQATVTTTTTTGPAPAAAPGAAAAPRPKRPAAPRPASAAPQQQVASAAPAPSAPSGFSGGGGSIKDGGYAPAMPGSIRAHGVWVEGYYDYERHENLNPGQQANPTRRTVSGGVLSGVDVSQYTTGGVIKGYQFGMFGGHNSTLAKFSDTSVTSAGSDGTSTQINQSLDARQRMEGGFAGIYGSAVHGALSADLAFKVDFFDVERTVLERELFSQNCAGEGFTATDTFRRDSTAMTNYVLASNANYRFAMANNRYLEPTVGLRYTFTDFGGNAATLGLKDGEVFRVQGGLRLGGRHVTPDGWIWQTALTGLLYSDVSISGYIVNGGGGITPTTALVDEGKLRVMGILESRVDVGYGYTFYGDVEVRGGEDVIGFGSRLGVRYQW